MKRIEWVARVLSAWMLAACYSTSPDAEADTSTSWLRQCRVQSDCLAGSECVGGWCTMPVADAAPPAQPSASQPEPSAPQPPSEPSGSQSEPASVPPASASGVPAVVQGHASGAFFELTDVNFQSSAVVGWADNHFVVSYVTSGTEPGESMTLRLARASTTGEVQQHSRPFAISWPTDVQLVVTPDGGIAGVATGVGCGLEVFSSDLQTKTLEASFPCSGDGMELVASPVPSSSDWLIAYSTGAYDEGDHLAGSVFAGRYLAASGTWAADPVALGARTAEDKLGVFAAGQDAVVVWGNREGAMLRSASAMAGPADPGAPASWSEPVALDGAQTISDGGYGLADLGEQRLLFSMYGSSLRAHVLGADGAVTMRDVASSTITDRVPGVAAAVELGLAGVCYARGPSSYIGGPLDSETQDVGADSMWFVMVDADGIAVSEPVMIADGLADNTGCDVAWSGEQFFAVTWGIFQEVVDNRYTLTQIRGVLVDPPELIVETRHLIDAIVQQTTLLIAQLATSAGIRAPLAHIADQVFLDLANEIEQQGVSRKVVADMFGLALRIVPEEGQPPARERDQPGADAVAERAAVRARPRRRDAQARARRLCHATRTRT